MEQLDIHDEQGRYEKIVEQIKEWKNYEIILEWLREKKLKNKCKVSTLARTLSYYKKFDEWFNKDFREVTQSDLENVITKLQDNKYKKIIGNGKKISYKTRGIANSKSELKGFFSWLIKKYKLHLDIDFIDTTKKDEEIDSLDMNTEIPQLIDRASSLMWKAGLRVLSDGGLRIEEFLNTTQGDYVYDKELNCYLVRIKVSKTKPRTISLPLSTKEINDYRESLGKIKPNDYFFPISYPSVRKYLMIHGKRVLGKHINPHLLRHVSCTFYANKLNHYQMCKRYGWSFNSPMPQKYIDRNGIGERETAKIIRSDEVGDLKLKLSKQEIDNKIYKETSENEIEELKKQINSFEELKKEMQEIKIGLSNTMQITKIFQDKTKDSKRKYKLTDGEMEIIQKIVNKR